MISDWSTRFNVKVVCCEERHVPPVSDILHCLVDSFVPRDGSYPADQPGTIPVWTRSKDIRSANTPDDNDDGVAVHLPSTPVLDLNRQPIRTVQLIRFWSDGFDK